MVYTWHILGKTPINKALLEIQATVKIDKVNNNVSQGFRNKTATLHFCWLFKQIWDLYLGEVCLDVALLCWQGVSHCGFARLWCHVKYSEKWISSSSAWHERLAFQHYDIICYCVFPLKFDGAKMIYSWPHARLSSIFSAIQYLFFIHSLIHSLKLITCSFTPLHILVGCQPFTHSFTQS